MLNLKTWSLALGLTFAISFVVCVAWDFVVPGAFSMSGFLEMVLPGFHWISPEAFVLGLVESFLFGVYGAVVFVPLHNWLTKRASS